MRGIKKISQSIDANLKILLIRSVSFCFRYSVVILWNRVRTVSYSNTNICRKDQYSYILTVSCEFSGLHKRRLLSSGRILTAETGG